MTDRAIHIVEDDAAVRASMAALMALREDVSVHCHESATAFLDRIGSGASGVLLLDFHMPGISGLELLAILNRGSDLFVTIIQTGHGDLALAIHAMKLGAFDFVEKPVTPDHLHAVVEGALVELDARRAKRIRSDRAQTLVARLTARERDVLRGLVDGKPNKMIAHSLGISPRTIEIHRARLMDKMAVGSLSEALRIAFDAGLLDKPVER